jgi:aerobic-type carbon monoxide dehydrogenase small subunit (CoxS/CutS family)
MSEAIEFGVNGNAVSVVVAPTTPLLYVLRNDLGLRGTRHGCGDGDCGACTILLDGRPVTACNTQVEAAAGHQVETIEALGETQPPHPLVDAVLAEQAGQCGYCLPGILMRAKALLVRGGALSREQIAAALDDHLCRCGAHNRIIRAIAIASAASEGGVQS